ncbi:MAG: hypothetical protein KKA62_00255 [Nanoarchaeota archaeon]|nr:hypothetical protein [Nanoarchaeota archaeon]MBU1644321.1 hypothetical protein [Nanoarchaeota archaeon]MBU1976368.1 hypothetical protein [Nanoarchaeota archaeon]
MKKYSLIAATLLGSCTPVKEEPKIPLVDVKTPVIDVGTSPDLLISERSTFTRNKPKPSLENKVKYIVENLGNCDSGVYMASKRLEVSLYLENCQGPFLLTVYITPFNSDSFYPEMYGGDIFPYGSLDEAEVNGKITETSLDITSEELMNYMFNVSIDEGYDKIRRKKYWFPEKFDKAFESLTNF